MSQKIVVDALHSPSLVGELKDYHKDLVGKIAKRGVLVLLSGIFLLLQYFGLLLPNSSSNNTSLTSDIVYGGFESRQDALLEYDTKGSDLQYALSTLSVSRNDLQNASESSLDSWLLSHPSLVVAWNNSPVYQLGPEETQPSSSKSTFFAGEHNRPLYGYAISQSSINPSSTKVLFGHSKQLGDFAILNDNGNILTTSADPDTCYKDPNESVSYVHCSNSNSFKSEIMVTNIGYKTDAHYLKNHAGDRLQYDIKLTNQSLKTIELKPEIYIGDVLEYSKLTYVDNARLDKRTSNLQWPQTSLQPLAQKTLSFSVQILNPIPINPRGSTNGASYDCYMTSFFGTVSNIKVHCPTPKIMEKMLSNPPSSSLLAIAWLIFIINTALYIKIYISAKEHGLILKNIRRKHD